MSVWGERKSKWYENKKTENWAWGVLDGLYGCATLCGVRMRFYRGGRAVVVRTNFWHGRFMSKDFNTYI